MTTNNPPIAAWAPSTALHKLASRHNNAPCVLTDGPAEFNDVALVRLSDCERLQAECEEELFQVRQDRDTHFGELMRAIEQVDALQAECEELREDAERYRWLRADALSAYEDDLDEPQLVYARECVGDYQDCIDAAIDAAMETTQ